MHKSIDNVYLIGNVMNFFRETLMKRVMELARDVYL